MEDVLEVYKFPYNEKRPVVCFDETSRQLIEEIQIPRPVRPGQAALHDYEYIRNGAGNLFMMFAPLAKRRQVTVTERRTCKGFSHCLHDLAETQYPDFEIHYTPKHGSRLNMAELEIGVMSRQCLGRRIAAVEKMAAEVQSWVTQRNSEKAAVRWQFTTADAGIKLQHLYPRIQTSWSTRFLVIRHHVRIIKNRLFLPMRTPRPGAFARDLCKN